MVLSDSQELKAGDRVTCPIDECTELEGEVTEFNPDSGHVVVRCFEDGTFWRGYEYQITNIERV